MLECLIDKLFIIFGEHVFQQTVGIPMCTNSSILLAADLFLCSHKAHFLQGFFNKNEKKLDQSIDFAFSCIDDALSLSNSKFGDYVEEFPPLPPSVFSGIRVTQSLVLCVCCGDRCLSLILFLLTVVLSVLLRVTDSDYLFSIFTDTVRSAS